jgi:hypothetical protein
MAAMAPSAASAREASELKRMLTSTLGGGGGQ